MSKRAPKVATIDFETAGIERRPFYPPVPVGVSIKLPEDRRARYYAWGHPTGNNCTKEEAVEVLRDAVKEHHLLFHNAKFDLDVMETHLGISIPSWDRVHDTMFMLFLDDPHASTFALKPSAERILGLPPTEQEAVRNWLVEQKIVRAGDRSWGAHIDKAPGGLVGKYAEGDVKRTEELFKKLYPLIHGADMLPAYDRERELMPILLQNEREGMRVDLRLLKSDIEHFTLQKFKVDAWIQKRLGKKDLNIDSDAELADALEASGVVTEFAVTETGRRSTSKVNMTKDRFSDPRVFRALGYRGRLSTCLGTFMEPWALMAESTGFIYTNWNQVRQSGGGDNSRGARTGRLSSNPNFQNIPKNFYDKDDGYEHPKHLQVTELPLMRRYIVPDKGGVFCHRDYNQQELRILAHFEDDKLCEAYQQNPRMDVHDFVTAQIHELVGLSLERRAVKILNFGMVYGMGLGKLAAGLHTSVDEAKTVKDAQRAALPGLPALERELKTMGRNNLPIRTWGGRLYYCEEPKLIDGRKQTYEYKLLNYLIQGSAADCTKQAVINYHKAKREGRFMATVHDEINISVPKKAVKAEMAILRESMESVNFDVPMLTDGKTGANWTDLVKFKEA